MSPSERVLFIRSISDNLSNEDYSIIDLILRQFNLPWTDDWRGDQKSYVISMIEGASDTSLIQLAEHLNIPASAKSVFLMQDLPNDCWNESEFRSNTFRLFISHLSSNKTLATEVQKALRRFAISGFVAHVDIEPTKEWQGEIETALHTADALVALLTPGFKESNWTDQEVGVAIGRGLLVLPVRLGLDPYGFIGKYQGLLGYEGDATRIAQELYLRLTRHKLTSLKITEAVVTAFENSYSYQNAKDNMGFIEGLSVGDAALLDRIRQAPLNNQQVKNAIGVPERVLHYLGKG